MITTNVKATHIELTPDINEYLEKRFESFEKFVDEDDTSAVCDIEIERSTHHQRGNVFRAEVTLHTRSGTYRADAEAESVEASIDKVKDLVNKELRRDKRKRGDLLRKGGAKIKDMISRRNGS